MITNEREMRIALEAALACTLAFYGLWGCALLVVLLMLPWRPLLAVGAYLAQPIVDWRVSKTRVRPDQGITRLVGEAQVLLADPREAVRTATPAFPGKIDSPLELPSQVEVRGPAHDPCAPLAIPPAIRSHLQTSHHAVFSNMELEVEAVAFEGDTARAVVRFQSSSVSGLTIRRRYILRQADGRWQVDSLEPAEGPGQLPQLAASSKELSVRAGMSDLTL